MQPASAQSNSVLSVLIVGSGFAGLGLGARLRQAGVHDFEILERGADVGGTWRDNQYPGAACDVESHLYSFSFAQNPDWTRQFAPQREILDYLRGCADRFGLRPHLRLSTEVRGASYDAERGLWEVRCSDGVRRARALVLGTGGLSRPKDPDIPGLGDFAGPRFHSARWDHAAALRGKTVGVIGTGASAIQIVPAIAPEVRALSVFQRTPPWILPKRDRAIGEAERALFRAVPAAQRLARAAQYVRHELYAVGMVREPGILRMAEKLARLYVKRAVRDPALREALTPRYTLGCKRILLSNDYYPAVQRDNVAVITSPITRVTPNGVRCADGVERRLDVLILATGFQASEHVAPFPLRGPAGRDLSEHWAETGPEAYLGTTVSGFPNLFIMTGPNTGLGHSSMVLMIESQITYVLGALRALRLTRAVDVRPEVQAAYNQELQAKLARTVWQTGGCSSWYQTAGGKNTTLWPGYTFGYRHATRRFDSENYTIDPRPPLVTGELAQTASQRAEAALCTPGGEAGEAALP